MTSIELSDDKLKLLIKSLGYHLVSTKFEDKLIYCCFRNSNYDYVNSVYLTNSFSTISELFEHIVDESIKNKL